MLVLVPSAKAAVATLAGKHVYGPDNAFAAIHARASLKGIIELLFVPAGRYAPRRLLVKLPQLEPVGEEEVSSIPLVSLPCCFTALLHAPLHHAIATTNPQQNQWEGLRDPPRTLTPKLFISRTVSVSNASTFASYLPGSHSQCCLDKLWLDGGTGHIRCHTKQL
eukprot:scaffold900_cov430-Prasinococcus_capsulatus_cf.AAC.5